MRVEWREWSATIILENGRFLTCVTVWPARRVVDTLLHATSLSGLHDALRHALPPESRVLLGHPASRSVKNW
jgi:hypothetical protein